MHKELDKEYITVRPTLHINEIELLYYYFFVFSKVKDIEPFKDFLYSSIKDSKDPFIKSIIVSYILQQQRIRKTFEVIEIKTLKELLINSLNEIQEEDYKKYLMVPSDFKKMLDKLMEEYLK